MNFGTRPGHSEICYVLGSCRLDSTFCILLV